MRRDGNNILITIDEWTAAGLSFDMYRNDKKRGYLKTANRACYGNGVEIIWGSIARDSRKRAIFLRHGNPEERCIVSEFEEHIRPDAAAMSVFSEYLLPDGRNLKPEVQLKYYNNAIVLNALNTLLHSRRSARRALGNSVKNIWQEMSNAVNSLDRIKYPHTLPGAERRLRERFADYRRNGYASLMHGAFCNNNSRKVDERLERLILSVYCMTNNPYGSWVHEYYMAFIAGLMDIVDMKSGELYDRSDFFDAKKGVYITISEATCWNYINKPRNRAIVESLRGTNHHYASEVRPHYHRHSARWSLSKISLDDRDLPRRMHDGNRVKAYYAYDVASGALIGAAYSVKKDTGLFIDCIRDMFRFIELHGYGMPLEVEVEHHIVSQFKDDFMKAGVVFPFVRWCSPGNSQEKHAEQFNRQKKYGYEKRYQDGIGRFYARLEANRTGGERVYDEGTNKYVIREKTYTFDELVADDRATIEAYNNGQHRDRKRYNGMTRQEVLHSRLNPELSAINRAVLARYIGECVTTSIQRNMYCRVQYRKYIKGADDAAKSVKKLTESGARAWETLLTFNQAAQAMEDVGRALDGLNAPGIALNSNMADLQAITGLTGDGLHKIEQAARQASMAFGTSASANVESYKLLLSQLSPELGKNSTALKLMGDNVNILSKGMGGDTVAAANALTTALNQYGVNMDDPIAASKIMAEYMNIMAAAAREGSAELPQIQQALSQAGMMAKTVGVTFSETNAAIQVLDKAGKKGAEGGVALRNVLSSLAKGRFLPKDVQEELTAAGVSINRLTDQTMPLADRLRSIGPIFNDTALMSKLFGRENVAAAIALAGQTGEMENLNTAIQGTNTAIDQANIVMDSYAERIKRQTAWFDNLKTGIFQAAQPVMPFITGITAVAGAVAQAGFAISGFNAVSKVFTGLKLRSTFASITEAAAIKRNSVETARNTGIKGLGTLASKAYAIGMGLVTAATTAATMAVRGLSKVIYSIPLAGWILIITAAVGALIAGLVKLFRWLWDNSRVFRGVLSGIAASFKAAIHNTGLVFQRLWQGIVKPVFTLIAGIAVSVWQTMADVFYKIRDVAVSVFHTVWSVIISVWNSMRDFFVDIWNRISGMFSAIGGFLYEWVVKPFMEAFSTVWDFVVNLFDKIKQYIITVFQPVTDLVKWVFGTGSEETRNVIEEAKKGYQQGVERFDEEKKKTEKAESGFKELMPDSATPVIMPAFNDINTAAMPLGDSGNSSVQGARNITLKINKLIETMQISVTSLKESKEQIKQVVAETLLTAVNDINLAQ